MGLANATLQQRLVAVRLFYDHQMEEGRCEANPVGRGRYTPGKALGRRERGIGRKASSGLVSRQSLQVCIESATSVSPNARLF